MELRIRRAAVLGAGIMGSQIAAHLANVGIPSVLLDIVPTTLTPQEQQQGWTLHTPAVRNRLAQRAKEGLQRLQPAPLYLPSFAERITAGNMQDHLPWLTDVDWVIEAVPEQLEIKRQVYQAIVPYVSPTVILSSNTSGLPLTTLSRDLPAPLQGRFLGSHFFNPPRYLKLLEVIPTPSTDPVVLETMLSFGRDVLGKGVVQGKDTPNFIANRLGIYGLLWCVKAMLDDDLTISDVDAVTGPPLGRPASATFRTADLVGLDTLMHVAQHSLADLPAQDPIHQAVPQPNFLQDMLQRGWLGNKTGQGFYQAVRTDTGREFHTLDYRTLQYQPQRRRPSTALQQVRAEDNVRQRLRILMAARDWAGQLAWKVLRATLYYAAWCVPEIADDILSVDQAMRWGFQWEIGPFEIWDTLGVERVAQRLQQDGWEVPALVTTLLAAGHKQFYRQEQGVRSTFLPTQHRYDVVPTAPRHLALAALEGQHKVIQHNPGASLIDLGEGVACLAFHTKMNAIGGDAVAMMDTAGREVERHFRGLVIGNDGEHFSAGANLALVLLAAQNEEWDVIEQMVRLFQEANLALKYLGKPVVAAPFGMTLAGGCEVCLAADRIRAAAETYMGLVEMGVGLIPAGGGCKELWLRHVEGLPADTPMELFPLAQRVFQLIGLAKVSGSAAEARQSGFLRRSDAITVQRDALLYDARQTVLDMVAEGYRPPTPPMLRVVGRSGYANFLAGLHNMELARQISAYDQHIGRKLAYVLAGGDVPDGSLVSEQHLLDLEREAFLSLCGEPRTQERMRHMLERGQPLRN